MGKGRKAALESLLAKDYVDWLETRLPHLRYSGHQVCNHLISLSGDDGEGEVYAIAWHAAPAANGAFVEDIQLVRYLDRYRKEDGRWRFASRDVAFDFHAQHPIRDLDWAAPAREGDLSQLHRPTSSTGSLSNV
jgi:hypothetical protein